MDGGARDLHSGNDGGVFNEPMADLCKLLSTLVDSQHNILVPGFYDDVAEGLLEPTLAALQVRSRPVLFLKSSKLLAVFLKSRPKLTYRLPPHARSPLTGGCPLQRTPRLVLVSRQLRAPTRSPCRRSPQLCVPTETRHLDGLGQHGEFEQDSNTDSE